MDTRASVHSLSYGNDYDSAPPVLVVASSLAAGSRAAEVIGEGGHRAVQVPLEGAAERIEVQATASTLWIEVDRIDDGIAPALSDLIVNAARFPKIVSTRSELIDPVAALIGSSDVDLIADAQAADRLAALALARAAGAAPARLNDISAEPSAARLRQLSDEVGRIAASLARLSSGAPSPSLDKPMASIDAAGAPAVSGDAIRHVIRARRLRTRYFEAELFADPAWDMLLDLFQAEIAQHRVPVSSLCIAAAVPPTTALRWIKTMTDAGLFMRRADPHDGRRIFVELSPATSDAMRRYFGEVGRIAAI